MTFPGGHPDWQTYANWRGLPIVNDNFILNAGVDKEFGAFVVTNWASLYLNVVSATAFGFVQITYQSDIAGTVQIKRLTYHFVANRQRTIMLPILGNVVDILVHNSSGVNANFSTYVAPTNIPVTKGTFPDSEQSIMQSGVTIPHGTTQTFGPVQYRPGTCHIRTFSGAPANVLNLQLVKSNDGTTADYVFFSGDPTTNIEEEVTCPDAPWMVQVSNSDASDRTCTFTVVPQPNW